VFADNLDLTTYDSYQLTNLQGVVAGSHKIANHGFYPAPWYAAACLKPNNTGVWGFKILNHTVESEYTDAICPNSGSCRMTDPIYTDNWNSNVMPDTGLNTAYTECPYGGCNYDLLNGKEIGLKYKVMFLQEWFYLYNDLAAAYEAQRTILLLQDNHEWWPEPIDKVTDATFSGYNVDQRNAWFEKIRKGGEGFSQYACRWLAMRGFKNGTLPSGNQFVADPLTW
jgi:hypothetical protein